MLDIEYASGGGIRVGNRDAPVKVIEYMSLACGHCADFAAEAWPTLREQIRSGRASLEYKPFVIDHFDLAATLLSRCVPKERYFEVASEFLARQREWLGRARALTPAQRARIEIQTPTPESVRLTAQLLRLEEITDRHGLPRKDAQACLSEARGIGNLFGIRRAAERLGVRGTPSFIVNGRLTDAYNWQSLQPLLGQP
jgi:protein-disulfide isomerase